MMSSDTPGPPARKPPFGEVLGERREQVDVTLAPGLRRVRSWRSPQVADRSSVGRSPAYASSETMRALRWRSCGLPTGAA
jgi:hypothetical protein